MNSIKHEHSCEILYLRIYERRYLDKLAVMMQPNVFGGFFSDTSQSMCTKYWLTACSSLFKLAQEKVWLGDRTVTLNKVKDH